MGNFEFVKTQDNSVGLYDNNVDDIYHSRSGALKEAKDKFIFPSGIINKLNDSNQVKVLDICYGIGYNTKALLNEAKYKAVKIDCLEINNELIQLSPLLKDGIDNIELKLFLINKIFGHDIKTAYKILEKYENKIIDYFDENIADFIKFIINKGCYSLSDFINLTSLHNIYYQYISKQSEYSLNNAYYENIDINYHIDDARRALKTLSERYDFVFIDAFSPQKDPTLWTIDFLELIKSHINHSSVILTYSKSTPVRNALLKLNFNVGKIILDNIDMGTIASLDKTKIKVPLNEFDMGLCNTTAGIMYKDPNLDLESHTIIFNRQQEQKNSKLLSATKFLKSNR